jgi:hypothetical protein
MVVTYQKKKKKESYMVALESYLHIKTKKRKIAEQFIVLVVGLFLQSLYL